MTHRISFVEVEAVMHARFPQYEIDKSTFRSASTPVEIRCSIHDHRFRIIPIQIIHGKSTGCPTCHAEIRQQRRRDQRQDYDAEQHLRRIATELSQRHVDAYRYWLAGETLWEIARRHGVTAEAVRLRLKQVGDVLDASAVDHAG